MGCNLPDNYNPFIECEGYEFEPANQYGSIKPNLGSDATVLHLKNMLLMQFETFLSKKSALTGECVGSGDFIFNFS
jgi:hypothetical protein